MSWQPQSSKGSKGENGGWLLINFGWGLGVFVGVYVAFPTGAHLNPAVTLRQWMVGNISAKQALVYFCAELLGAFIGAVLCWVAFRDHFDAEPDPGKKLGVFSTGPAIRSPIWNILTEIIATFVLIFWVLMSGGTPTAIGPLGVALVVLGIGASLGGPTGYAINPARDLGPRIAHFVLPDQGQGLVRLGLLLDPGRGTARRRRAGHPALQVHRRRRPDQGGQAAS